MEMGKWMTEHFESIAEMNIDFYWTFVPSIFKIYPKFFITILSIRD